MRRDVQEARARPAAQVLVAPADRVIERAEIDGDHPGGVVAVHQDPRPDLVRLAAQLIQKVQDLRLHGGIGGKTPQRRWEEVESLTPTREVLDGRYRIDDRIARGGMASVYEAHDTRLDRAVAIKIMHAGLGDATSGDEAFAARFVREARAAARLSHPNVVAVYDVGTIGEGVFVYEGRTQRYVAKPRTAAVAEGGAQ